jgi:hypothetical protein
MKNVWISICVMLVCNYSFAQQVFSSDIKVNGLTVGRAGGNNSYNTALGASALTANTTGIYNTAVGYQALPYNTTGESNTAVGFNSFAQLSSGSNNVAIGDWTSAYLQTGSFNTIIGSRVATSFASTMNNTLMIGTYNSVSIYSPSSGNIILGGSTTDNGLAKLQVNGGINQSSVKSALLKADANGTLVPAVAGTDYATPGAASGWSLTGNTNASSNFLGTTDATDLVLKTNGTERVRLIAGGNVLIGKTTQANATYLLDVAGKIRADKLMVNTSGADFVFDSSYRLMPLKEVANYIQKNRHLPDIVPAGQMEQNGLDVGDHAIKLLQKIEELTLYVIQQNKQIELLKQENQQLLSIQAQLEDLKRQIHQSSEQKHKQQNLE